MQENTIQSLTYNDLGQVSQLRRGGHQADMSYQYDLLQGVVSGIASINGLISVTFTNDRSIEYYYTADGTRHKAIHVQQLASGSYRRDTTDYVCGMILKGRHPESYQFDGGYATFSNDAYAGWHYYIQDYMGNNRMVVNRNGSTEQKTHYYPYGGVIGDISTNESLQKYKFEGKELDRSFGLDNYDIQARQYFAMAPVWDRPDPLAEKYYGISPYAYCGGDPVNRKDVDGKEILANGTRKDARRLVSLYNQGASAKVFDYNIEQSLVQNPNWKSLDANRVGKAHNQALQIEKNCRGISSPEYQNEINGDKTELHIVDVATDESVDIFKIENGNIKK